MPQGYYCLVLHAHLPFVRHPEHNDFMEEDWLYEGITETYIPILEMLEGLEADGVDWRLTMSVTPPLAAMLDDTLLQNRYIRHIDNLIALSRKEVRRARFEPEFHRLAKMYLERFEVCRSVFVEKYQRNLLNGFRKFYATGKLELITCCATHGFLPLMHDQNRRAARVQIELGASEFARHFGKRPRGIWLAECGYTPGVEQLLNEAGIQFFFTDTHGILYADPRPRFGVFAPIFVPNSGVAVFARDSDSSRQVWSSIEGYPGDVVYRDFYRDVGFDMDEPYIKPHMHEVGIRTNLGIKYYSITGDTAMKKPYDRQAAMNRVQDHARHFLGERLRQLQELGPLMDGRPPLVVAPYDAELFGHWWYEGPEWLNSLFRQTHYDQDKIAAITPPEYLQLEPVNQICQPPMCSWGAGGYNDYWLNDTNDWIYPHLHMAADRMTELAEKFDEVNELQERALNQAARELLLAQASDWAFIMKAATVVEYANKRTKTHIDNFSKLYLQLLGNNIDEYELAEMESRSNIFPTIDFRIYR